MNGFQNAISTADCLTYGKGLRLRVCWLVLSNPGRAGNTAKDVAGELSNQVGKFTNVFSRRGFFFLALPVLAGEPFFSMNSVFWVADSDRQAFSPA